MKELYYKKDTREEDNQTFINCVILCDTIEEYQNFLKNDRKSSKEFNECMSIKVGKQQTFKTLYGIEVNAKGYKAEVEDDGGRYFVFKTQYILKPNV